MTRFLKIISFLAVVGLLCWLALGQSTYERRRKQINQELERKMFGQLSSKEYSRLLNKIQQLCTSVGVVDIIELNKPFLDGEKNKLHFFIVTPAVASATNCAKGNAVFDASLHSIFIDQSIFMPDDWLNASIPSDIKPSEEEKYQLVQDEIPFNAVYAEFVILHELGHYKLNSGSGGLFDYFKKNDGAGRADEIAADSFALSNLISLFQFNKVDTLPQNIGLNIGLFGSKAPQNSQLLVGLVEMAHMSVLGKLIGLSPISPYYEDRQHPTFILRLRNMLETLLKRQTLNDTIRQKANYAKAEMDAYLSLASFPASEVITDAIINTVSFGEKEIFISVFNGDGNDFYKLSNEKLAAFTTTVGSSEPLVLIKRKDFQDITANDTNWVVDSWYGKQDGFISAQRNGELFSESSGSWKRLNQYLPNFLIKNFKTFCFPPEPSEAVYAVSAEVREYVGNGHSKKTKGECLFAIFGTKCKAELEDEVLERKIKSQWHVDSAIVYFRNLNVIDSFAYVPFSILKEDGYQLSGSVKLNINDLSFCGSNKFNMEGLDPYLYDENSFVTIPFEKDIKTLLIVKNQLAQHSYFDSWSVWELSHSGMPRKIGDYPFITSQMPESKTQMSSMFWDEPFLGVCGVQWLPPDQLIISWNNDAIYDLDLTTTKTKRFFYPGGNEFNVQPSKEGSLAIYAPGTTHLWVFHPK